MEYKYILSPGGELYHYGVKGMKWGVRRYQNEDGTLTPKGKERYHNTKTGMSKFAGMLPRGYAFPPEYKPDSIREVLSVRKENGATAWVPPTDPVIRVRRYRPEYITDPDSVFDKHMAKANDAYGVENGTKTNCTKVAATMCLAKKGFDYDAGRCMGGLINAFEYWFSGAERTVCDNLDQAIAEKFSRTPNGSYGTVDLRNKNGGGHVFNWERNSRGEFHLYEAQPTGGEKFSGSTPGECFESYITKRPWFSKDSTVRVYDMTNAQPNYDHMAEDSVVRVTDDRRHVPKLLDTVSGLLYDDI